MNTLTIIAKEIEFLSDSAINEMAAEASISLNRHVTWMKLVLTDDKANANRQKIPRDEFANVIKTGMFMPVKMGPRTIKDDHTDAFPLGTMAHLKVNGDTVEALAALWQTERRDDIELLKQRYNEGKPIDFSWELTYTSSDNIDGCEVLHGINMNAATIVGMPAYQGRTPALSVSSVDTNNGDKSMDTIEIKEHQRLMDEAKAAYETQITALGEKVSALETSIKELTDGKASYEKELDELRGFKKEIEDAKARLERLESIKAKFVEAGITADDKYYEEKSEILLDMNDRQLDFFVQELVSLSAEKENKDVKASIQLTSKNIPQHIGDTGDTNITPKDLVEYLKSLDKSK